MLNFVELAAIIAVLIGAFKTYFDAHPGNTDADTRGLIYTVSAAVLGALIAILAFVSNPENAGTVVPYLQLIETGVAASLPPGIGTSLLTLLSIKVLNSGGKFGAESASEPRKTTVLWM